MDAGSGGGRWLTVTVLTALLAAVAALASVTSLVDADHVWVLAGLTVAAAVSRACGHGGPRSVLILATLVLVMQPALHLAGELTDDGPFGHHGGAVGLLVVLSHIALSVVLVALMAAIDVVAGAVTAALRRLVRFLTWLVAPTPGATTTVLRPAPVDEPAHAQPIRSLHPPRRGPPVVVARS